MLNNATSQGRRIAGNILFTVGGVMLLASAGMKLAHIPGVVKGMAVFGIDDAKLTLIGAEEALCAIFYLIPRTRSLGLLLISAHMGGAIATHFQHNNSPLVPSIFLGFLWLGAWLRHPEVLWSFCRKTSEDRCRVNSAAGETASDAVSGI